MMYLWPQAGSMRGMHHRFGVITTAAHGCVPAGIKEGRLWAFDNECFQHRFDYERWLTHWHRLFPYTKRCLFVVMPDTPVNARDAGSVASLASQTPPAVGPILQPRPRAQGLAFAAQDGPWFDLRQRQQRFLPQASGAVRAGQLTEARAAWRSGLSSRSGHDTMVSGRVYRTDRKIR